MDPRRTLLATGILGGLFLGIGMLATAVADIFSQIPSTSSTTGPIYGIIVAGIVSLILGILIIVRTWRQQTTQIPPTPQGPRQQVMPRLVTEQIRYLLIVLWVIGLVGLVLLFVVLWVGGLTMLAVALGATYVVHHDVRAINQAKGSEVLSIIRWLVVTFFLWIVAIPWYVFLRRKAALAEGSSQTAKSY
jgi:hypothetical protein